MKAYQLIQKLEDKHWKTIKTEEIKAIIQACAGLYLEASSNTPTASNSSEVKLNLEVLNRSDIPINLVSYHIPNVNEVISKNIDLSIYN